MLEDLLIYLALGAVAGTLAGLLGVGGGLIIVPVLALVFEARGFAPGLIMHLAVGTSLATIVFTSISSVRAHHRRGAVLWPVFARLTPGIIAGGWLGALLADRLPSDSLRWIFGLFELLVAAQMAWSVRPAPRRRLPGRSGLALAGGAIGGLSALLGIGGGTLTVPFLVWCNVQMRQAVATSAACGLPIALAGAGGFIFAGQAVPDLPGAALGYVYLPALGGIVVASTLSAPFGAAIAHRVKGETLKRAFSVLLALLGLRMLLG